MSEEAQQNANAGADPTQQPSIPPSPPQVAEPAAVPVPESPAQEQPTQQSESEIRESQIEPDVQQSTEQHSVETISSPSETPQGPTPIPETQRPEQQESSQPVIEQPIESESAAEQTNQPTQRSAPEIPESPIPQSAEPKETIVERVRDLPAEALARMHHADGSAQAGLNESEKQELFKTKLKSLSPKGVSARRGKRQANYDKIIAHLKIHGYIANNEVETLCRVKDSTARKYLNDLEKQGILLQIGSRGRRVRYRLTQGNQ